MGLGGKYQIKVTKELFLKYYNEHKDIKDIMKYFNICRKTAIKYINNYVEILI